MKILIMSDSHASLRFMRQCIEKLKPDTVIHLGDYYDDAETLAEEYPQLVFHHVPGNCDKYRCSPFAPRILNYAVGGVKLYMTHGHNHQVKSTLVLLLADARKSHSQAALYGHTHVAEVDREENGMWVMNPGTAGYGGGSAGLIETDGKTILSCRIITGENLEEFV